MVSLSAIDNSKVQSSFLLLCRLLTSFVSLNTIMMTAYRRVRQKVCSNNLATQRFSDKG
ncbi:hypothetical protein PORCRE_2129 [Porphyromonas crevioricanis JCM 15906]|uniref:Uncharacterized protein n=1 Tax=Porphyromonas crevioricanis JCM 15906 TaxID=1305617 RepID=T1CJC2_9PORP|nr:hypothetical protein PORCRE_2129 [Porphyromonas crevioricanis JCM 15906]